MRIDGQSFAPSQPAGTAFDAIIQNNVSAAQNMPFRIIGGGGSNHVVDNAPSREISDNTLTLVSEKNMNGQRPTLYLGNIQGNTIQYKSDIQSERFKLKFENGLYVHQDPIELNGKPAIRFSISDNKETFEAHPERKSSDITQAELLGSRFQISSGENPITVIGKESLIKNEANEPIEIVLWDDTIGYTSSNFKNKEFNFLRTSVAWDAVPKNFLELSKEEQLPYWEGFKSHEKEIWASIHVRAYEEKQGTPEAEQLLKTFINLGLAETNENC